MSARRRVNVSERRTKTDVQQVYLVKLYFRELNLLNKRLTFKE